MNTSCQSVALSNMDEKRNAIIQQLDEECLAIHSHAESSARAFYSHLSSCIPVWIKGYRCRHQVDNIFRLKSQAEAYTEELAESLQSDIKGETRNWVESQFVPLVQREITTLAQAVNSDTQEYFYQLSNLSVPVGVSKNTIVKSATPSKGNRIISAGASLLVGDLSGAIMGGAGGSDAMFKTVGCELGAGVMLGIVSLFTPVGLAALVAGAIASAFVGGTWALSSVESTIRKTLVKKTQEGINSEEHTKQFLQAIHSKIDSYLNVIREDVNHNLQSYFNYAF